MTLRKRDVDVIEHVIRSMSGRDYSALVNWLAQGCDGSLWEHLRPPNYREPL